MTTAPTPSYSSSAGLPFDDAELESKLVWIFGSPRTGSTWLLEMLCHPLKVDPREVGFKWREGWDGEAPALPVDEFLISSHLAPHQGRVVDIFGAPFPAILNRLMQRRASYAFSEEFADVWQPEVRRLTLVRLYAVVERARRAGLEVPAGLPLMVIKEVNGSHAADLVMSLFPRSRMILMLRDGRDILDSLLDANSPAGWTPRVGLGEGGIEAPEDRLEFVRDACRNWAAQINVCSRAYDAHDPDRRRRIRYEELLADTPGVLGDLATWLDLPRGPKRIQNIAKSHSFEAVPDTRKGPGKVRRSATPGAWREGLTTEEQAVAQEIMGKTLSGLGYE